MKKMLTLVLVLAVASLASATIVSPMKIVNLGAGLFGIDLTSGLAGNASNGSGDGSGGYFALLGVSGGNIVASVKSNMALSDVYPDVADIGLTTGTGVYGEFRTAATGAWTQAAGLAATNFSVLAGVQQLTLYSYDDSGANPVLVDTYNIPEPITMALLGLGGLFLRKRK
ncbi:MAG: PEP-CTERM sorting domain-containing protein [Phycisphaerae bacterium]|jgi:hypothetical protein